MKDRLLRILALFGCIILLPWSAAQWIVTGKSVSADLLDYSITRDKNETWEEYKAKNKKWEEIAAKRKRDVS